MVYSMVIQPAMTYGVITWHQPQSQDGLNQGLNETLAPFQNQCLQVITGAYQATPASILEAEAHVPVKPLFEFHDGPGYPTPREQWDGNQD